MRQEQDVSVHFPLKNTPIDYQLTELWYFTCPHPKTDRFGVGQLPAGRLGHNIGKSLITFVTQSMSWSWLKTSLMLMIAA
jgi:hypothetical protein